VSGLTSRTNLMENLRSARGGTLASKNQTLNKRQFIQYEPALVAELNEVKTKSQSVSARMLTLLYKRLSFWSRYAKHIHNGRRYFWKSIDELSEELQYSQKQISRGLKALVELGLIIREKLNKHNWKHTYYYYLPHSVHTAEEVSTNSSRSRSSYRDTSSNRSTRPSSSTYRARRPEPAAIRPEHQQFIPEERRQQETAVPAAGGTGAPVEGSGAPVAAGVPIGTPAPAAGTGFGASSSCRTTSPNPSAVRRTKCPHLSIEDNSILDIHLRQIVERCMLIGKYGIKPLTRGGN
jgi:DNA-binding MarR family transcriptional regulator